MMIEPIKLADRFTNYVNDQDVDGVLSVTDHNVELISPGKSAAGHETLAEWVKESGIQLETLNKFAKGNRVIFEQLAKKQGQPGESHIFNYFEMDDKKIHRIGRFDELDEAFGESGLSENDQVE
ncbi:nuclear transport factor 2 family protein [Planococcus sp. SSTMD024]|uniref:nuclear transport factor 2 family protein n=1 Tax=Planococcus sp. SSTMD024 TaxID=3242163 RepID=UPI00351DB39D